MQQLRVLQVVSSLSPGGAETLVMNLLRSINTQNVIFDFVVFKNEKCAFDEEAINKGCKIFYCPRYNIKNHYSFKKWWNVFLKKHTEYKIIHSHVRSVASIIFKISKRYNLINIAHSHSTSNGKGVIALYKNMLQKNIKKYADYLFACSLDSGKWLYGKNVINNNKFYVIKNAIDFNRFESSHEAKEEMKLKLNLHDFIVLGHVGRFNEMKNHKFIIDIFNKFHNIYNNSKLVLVGDGFLKKDIQKKVNSYNLHNYVLFTGNVPNVQDYVKTFDLFIFPSIYEGVPLSVVEAQIAKVPCIISDTITNEVIISNKVTKLSIKEKRNVWVEKIEQILKSKFNFEFNKEKDNFDINKVAFELELFYRSVTNKVSNI